MRKQSNIVIALNRILNDGFCQYSHHRAYKILENLKKYITAEEYKTLKNHLVWTDCDNPDVYGGVFGMSHNVKYEYKLFSEYIKALINKYEEVKTR
jgi:hypothetical protein